MIEPKRQINLRLLETKLVILEHLRLAKLTKVNVRLVTELMVQVSKMARR
jgi:hypothetical protein